jgi:hypothetical protein
MRFKVLMAVSMKITLVWDVMLYSLIDRCQWLEKPAASIFGVKDGGLRFI